MNNSAIKTSVVLVDDHPIFRSALKAMLEKDSRVQVVAEFGDGAKLIQALATLNADVVCMDISMPLMDGIEATKRIVAANPLIKVIGLSARTDRDFVLDMLKAGAAGYVTKTETGDELFRAISAVRLNRKYFSPEVAATLSGAILDNSEGVTSVPRLGPREKQVLQLVTEGLTSAEIADRLNVATSTVEVHRRNIMRKLDVHTVAGLTKYAIRTGVTTAHS